MAAMPSSVVNHSASLAPVRPATSRDPVLTAIPPPPAEGWMSGKLSRPTPVSGAIHSKAELPRSAIRKSCSVTGSSLLLPASRLSMLSVPTTPDATSSPNSWATGTISLWAAETSPSAKGVSNARADAPLALGSDITRRGDASTSNQEAGLASARPLASATGVVARAGIKTLPVRSACVSTLCQEGESGTHRSGRTSSSPSPTSSWAAATSATVAVTTSSSMHCPLSGSAATASSTRSVIAGATATVTRVVLQFASTAAEVSSPPSPCRANQPTRATSASTRPMTAGRDVLERDEARLVVDRLGRGVVVSAEHARCLSGLRRGCALTIGLPLSLGGWSAQSACALRRRSHHARPDHPSHCVSCALT